MSSPCDNMQGGSDGHLLAGLQQVVAGGVGDGLLDLHVGGWQHDGDVPLPGLAEALEELQGRPDGHQLSTPAQYKHHTRQKQVFGDIA